MLGNDDEDRSFFPSKKLVKRTAIVAVIVAVLAAYAIPAPGGATHKPADKVAAAGSTLEIMEVQTEEGESTDTATLLTGTMKTSDPTDLIFQVTAECGLYTDIKTKGNDESRAVASVDIWVEIDGQPVAVTTDSDGDGVHDDPDDGVVTFCKRDFELKTKDFEDENATIELFLETKTANAFNWIHMNAGSDTHDIAVKAQLEVLVDGKGTAKAMIGKRTLVVEPVKMANDVEV